MAKAALESVSGFNIFGSEGDHTTVMFADADAHTRNSSILSTLLPRESASKVGLSFLQFPKSVFGRYEGFYQFKWTYSFSVYVWTCCFSSLWHHR